MRIKSIIYRYTGLYLAHKEELDYLTSFEYWHHHEAILSDPENDLSNESIQGLLTGLWQSKYGFVRPYVSRCFGPWYVRVYSYFYCCYRAIILDLKKLFTRHDEY